MQRELVRAYSWLIDEAIRTALRRDPSLHTDIGGLWLEGLERLARCATRFDPERGIPFEFYARASLKYLRRARGIRTYSQGGFDSELIVDDTPTREDWGVVEEAIRYLDEESPYLGSLIRKRIEGATYQKIVEELGKALSTLHRDYARAVDRLKYHVSRLDGERAGPRGKDWGETMVDPKLLSVWENGIEPSLSHWFGYARHLVADKVLDAILAREKDIRSRGLWWSDDEAD